MAVTGLSAAGAGTALGTGRGPLIAAAGAVAAAARAGIGSATARGPVAGSLRGIRGIGVPGGRVALGFTAEGAGASSRVSIPSISTGDPASGLARRAAAAAGAAEFLRSRAPQPGQTRKPVGSGAEVIPVWQRGHFIAASRLSPDDGRQRPEYNVAAPGVGGPFRVPYSRCVGLARAGRTELAEQLFGGSPERVRALVQAAWPLAVGADLARRTEVLGLEGGILRIRVADARWRAVLHQMQPELLSRLRRIAGRLAPRRIGFVEGGMAALPEIPATAQVPASADIGEASSALAESAAQIADPALREAFLGAAARYLAPRRRFS